MEFTGERYIPSLDGPIRYEHLHRYALSLQFAHGKSVLDLASGEGYGSALLAEVAQEVVGVDIDPATVEHAIEKYGHRPNLKFVQGACDAVPLEDRSIDVVVSFETIEHHDRHHEMMAEIRRVLRPDGVLIISSPNRLIYSDKSKGVNPFHVKELYYENFVSLLARYFRYVRVYGQRLAAGSLLYPLQDSFQSALTAFTGSADRIIRRVPCLDEPMYFVAVCSDEIRTISPNLDSIYIDSVDDVWNTERADKERISDVLSAQLAEREQAMGALSTQLMEKAELADSLNARLAEKERLMGVLSAQLAEQEQAMGVLSTQLMEKAELSDSLNAKLTEKERLMGALSAQLAEREQAAKRLESQLSDREQVVQVQNVLLTEKERIVQALGGQLAERSNFSQRLCSLLVNARQFMLAMSAQLSEKDRVIHDLTTETRERENEITALGARLANAEQSLTSYNIELFERNKRIAQLTTRIESHSRRMSALEGMIEERDSQIADLQEHINSIANSIGWQLLQYLWRIRMILLPDDSPIRRALVGILSPLLYWLMKNELSRNTLARLVPAVVLQRIDRIAALHRPRMPVPSQTSANGLLQAAAWRLVDLLRKNRVARGLAARYLPYETRQRIKRVIIHGPSHASGEGQAQNDPGVIRTQNCLQNINGPRLLSMNHFRVLYISPDKHLASYRHRVLNYRKWLEDAKIHSEDIEHHEIPAYLDRLSSFDVIVAFRLTKDAYFDSVLRICKARTIPLVYDIDDYVFDPTIVTPYFVDGLRFLSDSERDSYLASIPHFREACLAADYCTTPTAYLAEACRQLGKDVWVLPNGLSQEAVELSSNAVSQKASNDRLVIGYFSGTKTHQMDFSVVVPPLERILTEYDHVELAVVGALDLSEYPSLTRLKTQMRARPLVSWDLLPSEIVKVDINLAPLEIGNPYCEAKSELKYFDAAAVEVPTVASATDTFRRVIRHGETGFLACTDDDWYTALKSLIDDEDLRKEMGLAAKRHALNTYGSQVLSPRAYQAYASIIGAHRRLAGVSDRALSISFAIPPYLPGSGGQNKILSIARELNLLGHEIRLYVDGDQSDVATTCENLKSDGVSEFARLGGHLSTMLCCDALVATFWKTAYKAMDVDHCAKRAFYFVQDYEPYFYPMGENFIAADRSYDLDVHIISYGPWCLDEIRRKHDCSGDVIPYFIDHGIYDFNPEKSKNGERRLLLFFYRPELERRSYTLGIKALQLLASEMELKRLGIDIVVFGSSQPTSHLPFPHTNLGILPPQRLAALYQNARLGIVFSTTNVSMVGYEMMACGCPVLDLNINQNSALYGGGQNVTLAEPEADAIASTLKHVLTDEQRLNTISRNAYSFAKNMPDAMTSAQLFQGILWRELSRA